MFWCITAAGLKKTKCSLPTLYNGEKGQYHPEQDGNVDHTDHLTGTIRVMQTRHGQDIHCKQYGESLFVNSETGCNMFISVALTY